MFPGVDGFHWTFGHIFFVTVFLLVLTAILASVAMAMVRWQRRLMHARVEDLRWQSDFRDLPDSDRRCRHELTGELSSRMCPNAFDCRACSQHPQLQRHSTEEPVGECFGLPYSDRRLYHRGHTWVEPQPDGTVLIGLDEFAKRILGQADSAEMPPAGSKIMNNGTGWTLRKDGVDVRVLAPVDGEVVETGGPEDDWYLRVRPVPDPPDFRHLLCGAEVRAWIGRELERLQTLVAAPQTAAALADGGELIHGVIDACSPAQKDVVLGGVFLEP